MLLSIIKIINGLLYFSLFLGSDCCYCCSFYLWLFQWEVQWFLFNWTDISSFRCALATEVFTVLNAAFVLSIIISYVIWTASSCLILLLIVTLSAITIRRWSARWFRRCLLWFNVLSTFNIVFILIRFRWVSVYWTSFGGPWTIRIILWLPFYQCDSWFNGES